MEPFERPNLFRLATSELSQDAAVGWLLSWADPRAEALNPALHRVGRDLVGAMFARCGLDTPPLAPMIVHKQWSGEGRGKTGALDLVVEFGGTHVLAIEDKTGTGEHSGQLERYAAALGSKYSGRALALVFLRTGDQSSYEAVRKSRWHPFLRKDLIAALGPPRPAVQSDIFRDFVERLETIEGDVQSWRTAPLDKWSNAAWSGFYMALQEGLGTGEWSYVANPSGGFMGFWWAWTKVDGGSVYLQLEQDMLVAKVDVSNTAHQAELRGRWSRRLLAEVQEPKFVGPGRFGRGRFMTVARLADPYRRAQAGGALDLAATIEAVQQAAEAIVAVAAAGAPAQTPTKGVSDRTNV